MPSPKKKLPTGPIRIDIPTPKPAEAEVIETRKQDSSLPESMKPESIKQDSIIQESGSQEIDRQESLTESLPEPDNTESGLLESGLTEYKKVAMRLSAEAAESLRQLRVETGIPYEILVDVMVRNWDNLPQRTQAAYLKQAKQVRMERLMAGQEKTMKTMRKKYLG
jgi:hypothetical protein